MATVKKTPVKTSVMGAPQGTAPVLKQKEAKAKTTTLEVDDTLKGAFQIEEDSTKKLVMGIYGATSAGKTTTAVMLGESLILQDNIGPGKMFATYEEAKEKCGVNAQGNIYQIPVELSRKVGIIDTEHGRAKQSANADMIMKDYGAYHTGKPIILGVLDEKFLNVKAFNEAKEQLKKLGCEVIIVDSATHLWYNMQEKVRQEQKQTSNQYGAWGVIKGDEQMLNQKILVDEKCHVITCMRAKQDVTIETINGKAVPVVQGTKADIRDSVMYEFNIMFLLEHRTHNLEVVKDNTGVLVSGLQPDPNDAIALYGWCEDTITQDSKFRHVFAKLQKRFSKEEMASVVRRFLNANGASKISELSIPLKLELNSVIKEELLLGNVYDKGNLEVVGGAK
jgi:RecA/RadA recombinase